MQKITPYLWFNDQAEEAANFYVSIFKDSKVGEITRYGASGSDISGQEAGSVMTVNFELEGQQFVGLNGGPLYSFTPAISLFVSCETQDEVDEIWERMTADGEESRCGWLKDKYGVSWQIVPKGLGELLHGGGDPEAAERAMAALLQMSKLDLNELRKAAAG